MTNINIIHIEEKSSSYNFLQYLNKNKFVYVYHVFKHFLKANIFLENEPSDHNCPLLDQFF